MKIRCSKEPMSARNFIDDIFNSPQASFSEWIQVYTAKEVIQDKYEQNTQFVYNNPLPIRALVVDFTAAQANWKMPGIQVSKVKEIFIHQKYRSLIEQSAKISIEGEDYEGWRVNGKMQIRQMAKDIIRIYVYIKVV